MVKTVNIRALKDRLSAYLKEVDRGDVVLITDRGRVVAEMRRPTLGEHAVAALQANRDRLIESGALRVGLPHDPRVYRRRTAVRLAAATIDAALAFTRGDR